MPATQGVGIAAAGIGMGSVTLPQPPQGRDEAENAGIDSLQISTSINLAAFLRDITPDKNGYSI